MPSENKTQNFGLNQWTGNEYPKREDFVNDNSIIDVEIKNAQDKAEAAFRSASDGKSLIKNAITGVDPEVTIPTDATFAQLADAIGQIQTGINTDDATATAEKILAGMTAYVKGIKVIGTMIRRAGGEFPGYERATSVYAYAGRMHMYLPKGAYIDGTTDGAVTGSNGNPGVFFDEPNLNSGNIRSGKSIFGVQGNSNVVDTSDGILGAETILVGYSGYSKGSKYNGSMPNIGQQIVTPSTANKNIAKGCHNGDGYVKGDANLIPENILQGKNIFGVVGSVIAGKRFATGTVTSKNSSSNLTYTVDNTRYSTYPGSVIEVTGLQFKPSIILAHRNTSKSPYSVIATDIFDNDPFAVFSGIYSYNKLSNRNAELYINNGAFKIPTSIEANDIITFTWYAWE